MKSKTIQIQTKLLHKVYNYVAIIKAVFQVDLRYIIM